MRRKINREWKRRYHEKAKPAYDALMKCYPFTTDDIEGESWRDIKGYEGGYKVSNFGRVKSFKHKTPHLLKPAVNHDGYLWVVLCKNGVTKHFLIHKLVAVAFIPNPNNLPEVNHISAVKLDNSVGNLEWVTRAQNMQHAANMGLIKTGEDNPQAKLTNADIVYIRDNPDGLTMKELAEKFGVIENVVSNIQRGLTYKNVGGEIREKKWTRTPDEIRAKIRAEYQKGIAGCGLQALAKKYGLNAKTIRDIVHEGDS